jgi:hypothetical protein
VSDVGEGRLELDELGSVVDGASTIGSGPPDLVAGNDAVTWAERLEASGVSAWVRRHRAAAVIGPMSVLLTAGGLAAWRLGQPPEYDPKIVATVSEAPTEYLATAATGLVHDDLNVVSLHVEPRAGEAISVLGITGPGVRASRASAGAAKTGPTIDDIYLVAGCDDPRAITATADDYAVTVRRTDAYGRAAHGSLRLPTATGARLAAAAAQTCFQAQVSDSLDVSRVALVPDVAHRTISARITLQNRLPDAILVQAVTSRSGEIEVSGSPDPVPAGQSVEEEVSLSLTDCGAVSGNGPTVTVVNQFASQPGDLDFYVVPVDGRQSGADLAVEWSPRDRATIAAALTSMCARGPGAAARVLSASPAPSSISRQYGFAGPTDGVVLRMRVEITSQSSRVVVSDATIQHEVYPRDVPHQVTTASTSVRGGQAVMTVEWAAPCSTVVGPPTVWLSASVDGTTYPYRRTLDEPALARAYLTACPTFVPTDLAGFGWPTA